MEAGVLVMRAGTSGGVHLYWHLPQNRTVASLPDSRDLWDAFWDNRRELLGFAHSHPGGGIPGPSHTDVTTFAAVEDALGVRLDWWITSDDHVVVCQWVGPDRLNYKVQLLDTEPYWASALRKVSVSHASDKRP